MSDKRLFLIDGSALAYRSYFAFIRNPLVNSKGENTSVSFGFVNSLWSILNQHDPSHIAVVFDTKVPTHRHKAYPEYKSTRAKMPDEMAEQLPRLREVIKAMNIAMIEREGVEADDVIGTLAKKAAGEDYAVFIVTSDKDFNQLVNDKIKILRPQKSGAEMELIDVAGVIEKMGVPPEKVIDLLGLMGDSSDNIPGIPGVGPKTALQLLGQYETLLKVLDSADKITAKSVREKVLHNKDSALLSRELATILTDVDLDVPIPSLVRSDYDLPALKHIFLELEFPRFLNAMLKKSVDQEKPIRAAANYQTVTSLSELDELAIEISNQREVTLDTETTSLNIIDCELVGISLCLEEGGGWYIPVGHADIGSNLPLDEVIQTLKPVLENKQIKKTGQNLKYDYQVLTHYGIKMAGIAFDTMIASYLLNPSARQHKLDHLALDRLEYKMQPITDLIGSGKKQKSFASVPVDKATFYSVEDADIALRLRRILEPEIRSAGLEKLQNEIELPLIEVLAEMELAGVRIDCDYLASLSQEMQIGIDRMVQEIYNFAGYEFNINSTQQLQELLFDKLHLKTGKKTEKKTGFSTDMETLEELAKDHPLPKIILEYRQLSKLKSTYVDAIPELVNKKTGRVHTSFNQTIAATGRLSSSDPNLQNIPIRTEAGAKIRKAFVPRGEDFLLLAADYSQIELRIMAHISSDQKMIEAFQNNEDIHARTASEVYGVALDQVTPEMRRMAKTANFAIIYGVSAYGLSMQSEMSVGEAKQFIDTYFARYPGVAKYMESVVEEARNDGFVTTLFGRRRYMPEINSTNRSVRQFAERTAINTPIQGTAADMIKVAMIQIHEKLKGMKTKMILQVHDELVFDAFQDELENVREIVKTCMEKAVKLDVPVRADIGIGENWLECK